MISNELDNQESIQSVNVEEFTAALCRAGVIVIPGNDGSFWQSNEKRSLQRGPVWRLEAPSAEEIRDILRQSRAWVASYNREPDDTHPQNAWLYLCRNQNYMLEGLDSAGRRDARRALRSFRYDFVDKKTFLEKGVTPYCDTRTRVGLSDGTPEAFRRNFEIEIQNPSHHVIGAWKDDTLAAFLSLMAVDNWVTIGAYSATEHLRFCPNNGLIHFMLDHFLVQRKFQIISYGVSSIQEVSKADTLHRFKLRVGFEAIPIHRAFVFHPSLRFFVNPMTLWGLRLSANLWPTNRVLRKAAGLLAIHLGKQPSIIKCEHEPEIFAEENSNEHSSG